MKALWDSLAGHAMARPDAVALWDERTRLTYAELWARVESLAAKLARTGSQRVGVLAENGISWVLADLAASRAGCCVVPLPTFFSAQQHAHVQQSAQLDAVLTTQLWAHATGRTLMLQLTDDLAMARRETTPTPAPWAKVTYTSGTTGAPKGVCLHGDGLLTVARSLATATGYTAADRHVCALPLSTLLENIAGVYLPLMAGASIYLSPKLPSLCGDPTDGQRLRRLFEQSRATSTILTPALLQALLASRGRIPSTLRVVAVGGAPVPQAMIDAAWERGLPVYQGYGLSECASVVALNRPDAWRPGSVGRPLPHCELRLAPDGELLVRGVRFDGYLKQASPALHDGFLPTGDLAHIDEDGFLHIRGRKRDVIITSYGRNVSPSWVEQLIATQPGIRGAWVYGDDAPTLTAVVDAATPVHAAAAIAATNRDLPVYARVGHWRPYQDGLDGARDRRTVGERHGLLAQRPPIPHLANDQ